MFLCKSDNRELFCVKDKDFFNFFVFCFETRILLWFRRLDDAKFLKLKSSPFERQSKQNECFRMGTNEVPLLRLSEAARLSGWQDSLSLFWV